MRKVRHDNLFRWTLRGKPYFILAGSSLALLILAIGVM
jgi:hypothetical protein